MLLTPVCMRVFEDGVLQETSRELEDRIRALDEKLDEGQRRLLELLSRVESLQGEERLKAAHRETLEKERERLLSEAEGESREVSCPGGFVEVKDNVVTVCIG